MSFENMTTDEKIRVMSGEAERELTEKKLQIAVELQRHQDQRMGKRRAGAEVAATLGTDGRLPTVAALSPHEVKRYSVGKGLQAIAAREKGPFLEKEVSDSVSKDIGQVPPHGGIWVPLRISAALDTKTSSGGGYLAAKPVSGDIIDALKNSMKVISLGAQFISNVRFAPAFPVENSVMAASWVSENSGTDASSSDPSLAQRTVSGKFLAATTSMSRQLLVQSSAEIEGWIRSRIALSHALALDRAAIHGAGTGSEPIGLLQTNGIGDVAVGTNGGALTAAHLVSLELAVGGANGEGASTGFLTNALQRSKLRSVPEMTGGVEPVWGHDNKLLGHRAEVSNQVRQDLIKGSASNCSAVIYGDWSKLLLFEFAGAFEVVLDEYAGKKQGMVQICSWGSYDCLVQQPAAFAACKDAI